ncbi:MAG: hypothetical protein JOZ58_07860 [Acetobacteraceae bacterium]|nr:hypothetical protein [Acetobacteraceae bacterium]
MPQRIEAYLALVMGVLVVALGAFILWTQRRLIGVALAGPANGHGHNDLSPQHAHYDHHTHANVHHGHAHAHFHAHTHVHDGDHEHAHVGSHVDHAREHVHVHHHGDHTHEHAHGQEPVWHSHGWGTYHAHRVDLVADSRPKLSVLLLLGIAGGLLPDPAALAILLASISSGRLILGLATVLVFSLGFASALVVVGLIAARIGQRVLAWLDSVWAVRFQLATTLLIIGMGIVLTAQATRQLARLQGL